uniref:PGG domain-containing protein n=1 Tax=Kalanchoe fedtschenkoi TaxID=63787 RepID=A0A7N0T8E4_KALFE
MAEEVPSSDIFDYIPLYRAALNNDWEAAKAIFDLDEAAAASKITYGGESVLHIAVGTNCSHRFVEQLVNFIASKDVGKLRNVDRSGETALHRAARAGNTEASKALVNKDPEIIKARNFHSYGETALNLAAHSAKKETLLFLVQATSRTVEEDGTSPYAGQAGGDLMAYIIEAGFYDIALYLVNKYPNLAMEKDSVHVTALQRLAAIPKAFPSGQGGSFWKKLLVNFYIPTADSENVEQLMRMVSEPTNPSHDGRYLSPFSIWRVLPYLNLFSIWRALRYIFPLISHIHDLKLVHNQTAKLVETICKIIIVNRDTQMVWDIMGTAVYVAASTGIHEIIEECVKHYPTLIWYRVEHSHLFSEAIKHRQVKVYNLIYQMTRHVEYVTFSTKDTDNALHMVGRMPSPDRLSTVTGAALQMQRELQWFKEVEKLVKPSFKRIPNNEGKTPRMLFTEEHRELVKKGEKWMKGTSSSSTVVATLILTMSFVAVFNIPGGIKDDNSELFVTDPIYLIFAISDAVAVFSSATSVLMFLAILTSRFAEDDFLKELPKRLTFGLVALSFSIASTMVMFSAALAKVLLKELAWAVVLIPIGLFACVPVILYYQLQLPLLVELFWSTYGPSIFHKQNHALLH